MDMDLAENNESQWRKYLINWSLVLRKSKLYILGDLVNSDGLRVDDMSSKYATSKIVSRFSNTRVGTKNTCYVLLGEMMDIGDVPQFIADNFSRGFPQNWETLIQQWRQHELDKVVQTHGNPEERSVDVTEKSEMEEWEECKDCNVSLSEEEEEESLNCCQVLVVVPKITKSSKNVGIEIKEELEIKEESEIKREQNDENDVKLNDIRYQNITGDSTENTVPTKNTASKNKMTPSQLNVLVPFFEDCPRPTADQKLSLAQQTGLTKKVVATWFVNRRRPKPSKSNL